MKQLFFFTMLISSVSWAQTHYDTTSGDGNGFRFWNGNNSFKIHMGNTSEYHFGPVQDYSIKMNMNNDPDRGWTWGVQGLTPVAALSTLGYLQIAKDLTVTSGWLRVKGNRGLHFQDHGGGFAMIDDTWIRTTGNKSFYHNSGTMRTDGRFEVGPSGNRFLVNSTGNVGIGTTNPGTYKLAVNGKIRAKEIKVDTGWSDFVFEKEYKLPTLTEVENHIQEKGHLKDIPSAKEVAENGIFLGEMDSKLLQKIEELMLYTIAQEKQLKQRQSENQQLKTKNQELEDRLARLEKILLPKTK